MSSANEEGYSSLPPAEPAKELEASLSLLEEVLAWTMANLDQRQGKVETVLEPFLDVARTYAGHPCTPDPVVAELVLAALRQQFGPGSFSGRAAPALPEGARAGAASAAASARDRWRQVALHVANTIWEDPQGHDRVVRFWERLVRRAT